MFFYSIMQFVFIVLSYASLSWSMDQSPSHFGSQLPPEELIATVKSHDYSQMDLRTQQLEQVLYDNVKTKKLTQKQLKALNPQWHRALIPLFLKDTRLDIQLLKPYSDSLLENDKSIPNSQKYTVEKLLFLADNNNKQIILKSIALSDKHEDRLAILNNPLEEKIIDIASNEDSNCIIVATLYTVFIVKNEHNKWTSKTIIHDNINQQKQHIEKISLNNGGTQLCIVTKNHEKNAGNYCDIPRHVYLYSLVTDDAAWIDITQELKGNNLVKNDRWPYLQEFVLTNIQNLQWNRNDSLLLLECCYRHVNYDSDGLFARSHSVGNQYAFICPIIGKGWSENSIRKNASMINTADSEKIIARDSLAWFTYTKLLEWCDNNMVEALHYFDLQNQHTNYSDIQRLLGMILVHKIMQQTIIQLNKKETKIYQNNIPDAIKTIVTEIRTVLLYEKNPWKSIFQKSSHILSWSKRQLCSWILYGKNLLYTDPKGSCIALSGIILMLAGMLGQTEI